MSKNTVNDLLNEINKSKKKAIQDGVIREEKPLDEIKENEIPYKLPDGWVWVRLGNYALKVTDYVASGSFASLKENVLITNEINYAIMVKTADFSNGFTKNLTYTDEHGYNFLSNSNLFGGELILSNIGSIGKVFIVPYLNQPMTLASNTVMVKVTDDRLIKYLYYYFLSPLGQRTLLSISSGTSMKKFNKTQLKSTLVPIAPFDVQEQIVKKIEAVSKIIDARKTQLQKLDELIKARFVEMFGDININDKYWDIQPLGELCTIVRGGSPRPIENFLGGDIPWIKIGDATDGESIYLNSTKEHIIQEGVKKSRLVKAGSLIFANCGVSLGFARIITFDGCIHDGWLAMEDIDERLDKVFLLQALNQMTEHFRAIAPAGTQPNLNIAIMKAYEQIIPPMELQQEFIAFVAQVDKSKVAVQKALDEAQLLFDSLMQQYFG